MSTVIETAAFEEIGSAPPELHAALAQVPPLIDAGRLCLDFANTADWHASEQPVELIPTYPHLLAWAQSRGVLDPARVVALAWEARSRPDEAAAVHIRAIALREAIYGIFAARQRGKPVDAVDLVTINTELQRAFDCLSVGDGTEAAFDWEWDADANVLDAFLWPVARSIGELLTSPDVERVRECAGDPCGWLFLDTSRNRSRRWCSMETCGNRAKARRHYERSRSSRGRG